MINSIKLDIAELEKNWSKQEKYRDLFSKDNNKILKAVKKNTC
jgi:hypothetical protein